MNSIKGKVYTTNFSNLKSAIGIKISIARFNPKWLKDCDYDKWYFNLGPSEKLLFDYKSGKVNKDRYTSIYKCSLKFKRKEIDRIIQLLDSGNDVTLLCYESKGDFCHRHILREFLCSFGYDGNEI